MNNDLTFGVEQFPGCCGIGVAYGFALVVNGRTQYPPHPTFDKFTEEEVATICSNIEAQITSKEYILGMVSLVSKYDAQDKAQYPQIHEGLLERGWKRHRNFVNPNHENKVALYSKKFNREDIDLFNW
jgi:hypothetical protein